MKSLVICLNLALAPLIYALPDIEKTAVPSDRGLELYWWPKLSVPSGWKHDESQSRISGVNMLVPKNSSFDEAAAIMYARANYEPDAKKRGTLNEFIADDIKIFREKSPSIVVKEIGTTPTKAGLLKMYSFVKAGDTYERICYGNEGKFWILFVASGKTQKALDDVLPTFNKMLSQYK